MSDLFDGVYTGVYTFDNIFNTQTYKVLYRWHENFGLSLTAHMLCHVMQRPWAEIRAELIHEYRNGFFRVIHCPDINDVAYYVDYPIPLTDDARGKVNRYIYHIEYSDNQIQAYPPEEGYVSSSFGTPTKDYKFREKALCGKGKFPIYTPDQIIETLRGAIRAS